MSGLNSELQEIISKKVHQKKSDVREKISEEVWKAIDSDEIAKEALKEIREHLEAWLYLPCCHTSGTHDPTHFEEGRYICEAQKAEAFERFCKDLGVNPVVRSRQGCSWCENYPYKRRGEGLSLSV